MNINNFERASIIVKNLIPYTNELMDISSKSNRATLAKSLYFLSEYDKEFKNTFNQLLSETKQRLQKEFEEL